MASLTPQQIQYMREHPDDDQRANLYACAACCLVLPYIAVALRFVARRRRNAAIKTDDFLILLALVPLSGMCTFTFITAYYGLGRHVIYAKDLVLTAKLYIAGEICYTSAVVLAKFSVLFLYRRLFASKELTVYSIAVGILVFSYSLALICVSFLQCIPLYKFWKPDTPGYCIDTKPAYVTTAAMNVVTDVLILLLPVRFVWRLQMKTARKLQVIGLFVSGGVVCIFGIVRSVAVGTASPVDTTWSGVPGSIWSVTEMAVANICANLPTLRPLFVKRAEFSQIESPDGDSNSRKSKWSKQLQPVQPGYNYSFKAWTATETQMED